MDYLVFQELYHHGIKGQKWGERRFQNEDGSLTSAGEQRYYSNVKGQSGKISYNQAYRNENRRIKEDKKVYKNNLNFLKSQRKSGEIDEETYKSEKQRLKSENFEQKLNTQKANAAETQNISRGSILGGIFGGGATSVAGTAALGILGTKSVIDVMDGNKGKAAIEAGLALTGGVMAIIGGWEARKATAAAQAKTAVKVTGHGSIRESLQRQAQMEAAYRAGQNSR